MEEYKREAADLAGVLMQSDIGKYIFPNPVLDLNDENLNHRMHRAAMGMLQLLSKKDKMIPYLTKEKTFEGDVLAFLPITDQGFFQEYRSYLKQNHYEKRKELAQLLFLFQATTYAGDDFPNLTEVVTIAYDIAERNSVMDHLTLGNFLFFSGFCINHHVSNYHAELGAQIISAVGGYYVGSGVKGRRETCKKNKQILEEKIHQPLLQAAKIADRRIDQIITLVEMRE